MKREIKFRGRNDRHGWLTGHYFVNRGVHFIAEDGIANPLYTWEDYSVDPETVGQYTGLKDRNGKEIYEGDIVSAWSAGSHCTIGIIKWGKGPCSFFIGNSTNSLIWRLSGDKNGCETLEIIGNIHDNPELLEEGK